MKEKKNKLPKIVFTKSGGEEYVVCLHKDVPFFGKIIHIPEKERYLDFVEKFNEHLNIKLWGNHRPYKQGGVVLEIQFFLKEEFGGEKIVEYDNQEYIKERIRQRTEQCLKKYTFLEKGDWRE